MEIQEIEMSNPIVETHMRNLTLWILKHQATIEVALQRQMWRKAGDGHDEREGLGALTAYDELVALLAENTDGRAAFGREAKRQLEESK